ncbi:glutaminyl-peptide cyclotransferase [Moniliophthora roreri]|nr:glutaminyl-peptide cyclotransferase [Moniliophthora roreri]
MLVFDHLLPLTLLSYLFISPLPTWQASLSQRDLVELSSSQVLSLIHTPDPVKNIDPSNPASHLSKILIPRPPDTENNTLVRNHIASTLKDLGWEVEEDEFTDDTPYGKKRFTNVIATKDPAATKRVVLAAHFDSKFFSSYPMNQFVGATDSAAPCAMMLDLAEALNPLLDARSERLENGEEDDEDVADTTLQLVFFDGEEAFKDWTDTDSIYGARHLAERWHTSYIVPHSKRRLLGPHATELGSIEHLVLLDLLGAPQPHIRSFFPDTGWLYDHLMSVEKRLGNSGAFKYGDSNVMDADHWKSYFVQRSGRQIAYGYVGDDHVPFLQRGVPILHLIAEPFPSVWHRLGDNADALDIPTMRRWNMLLRVFMSEYLNLRPPEEKERGEGGIQRSVSDL